MRGEINTLNFAEYFKFRRLTFGLCLLTSLYSTTIDNDTLSYFHPNENDEIRILELKVFKIVNEYREQIGLRPLIRYETISSVAREHSSNMATGMLAFGHSGFNKRVQEINYYFQPGMGAENLAFIQGYTYIAESALDGWLDSPSHRSTIEGNFVYTGVGIAREYFNSYYITQIFWR